ncbi:MAG: hypothetical protein E7617_06280 [Ruminococcaceae bacterium]|nr:hypothetical protein [Oscillospiraceae bacterium]
MSTFLLKAMNFILFAAIIIYIFGGLIPFVSDIPYINLVCEVVIGLICFIKAFLCFGHGLRKDGITFLVLGLIYVVLLVFRLRGAIA